MAISTTVPSPLSRLAATLKSTFDGTNSAAYVAAQQPAAAPSRGVDIHIKGLEKRFGDKTVLSGIDLEIPAGQFVAIVGHSGCGKSTLLRLLVGLDQPSAGEIRFGTEEATATNARARIVFQEPRLLPWAKIDENVGVGLPNEVPAKDREQLILDTLHEVGLRDRAREWPSVLSGGQKQRVALARALVSHPALLALDEPLGALDALTRMSMQTLLERVWYAQGMTAVLVTHDVAEAVALADRVIVLHHGKIHLDLNIPLNHPRERGSPEFAALEGRLLDSIFGVEDVVF